ncbi:MAG: tetratricopeptide repeat protein [Chloroflexota bacterium]
MKIRWFFLITSLLMIVSACQPEPVAPAQPTIIPFPTATPGTAIRGMLPTPNRLLLNTGLANPATAVAAGPTPTDAPVICPPTSNLAELNTLPDNPVDTIAEILRFLSAGGTADALETGLRDNWDILTADGFVRNDIDITGDGANEVVMGYVAPDAGGTLLIAGCENRRYVERYRLESDEPIPPELLSVGDINFDNLPDVVFALEICTSDDEPVCERLTQVASYRPEVGRIAGLVSSGILSNEVPELRDTDDDSVQELILRQDYVGNITTGPQRTGLKIYDWNGIEYVLSIVQPDPLRYRIQVIHQADRYFVQRSMEEAIRLYQQALVNEDLDTWLRNETPLLEAYILYRMLLARAFNNEPEAAVVYQRIIETYPPPAEEGAPAPPIYVELAQIFWDSYQVTGSMAESCQEVRTSLQTRRDAIDLLNRYGTRNPSYTANDLCPF